MQQIAATVIALVGRDADRVLMAAGAAANVHAVDAGQGTALDRAQRAWSQAVRAAGTYVVHDADPLAQVADAWVGLFDQTAGRDALALAVGDVVARWRARALELPDYYLVLDAEELPATRRHWYLGVLRSAAPARVVPVDPDHAVAALGHLRSGRWWPDVPRLLDGVDEVTPDALATAEETGGLVAPPHAG